MSPSEPVSHRIGAIARSVLVAVFGVALLLSQASFLPTPADARERVPSRVAQERFMWAMATRESSRDYYARNRSSGAFGKYQIMPFNWGPWSLKYLGDAATDQTPWNQERVAYGKLRDLHEWLGSWRRVAYWWLTGSKTPNEGRWTSYARGYVDDIMRLRKQAPAKGSSMPPRTSSTAQRGDWRRAGLEQRLHLTAAGHRWQRRGRLEDGQILKVQAHRRHGGDRWLRVATADSRVGWVKQARTVPAHKPAKPRRWRDPQHDGRDQGPMDRRMVRLRPR